MNDKDERRRQTHFTSAVATARRVMIRTPESRIGRVPEVVRMKVEQPAKPGPEQLLQVSWQVQQ